MHRLAALIPLVVVATFSTTTLVAAQEASPAVEPGPPSVAECQIAPRSEAEIAVLSGTPVAANGDTGVETPIELPVGEPVDDAARAGIEQTLREVIACAEAGDLPRLLALYSDEAVRRFVLADEPVPIVPGQPSMGSGTFPATPAATADLTPVIQEARLLPDGRVAAVVTSVAPDSRAEIVFFIRSGDRWLIDEVHPMTTSEATPIGGDNPMAQTVLADAATRLGIPVAEIEIVSLEAKEWSDASLGCPQPGGFYAQVITPGYLIVVSGAGQRLEYHTDTTGHFVVCSEG